VYLSCHTSGGVTGEPEDGKLSLDNFELIRKLGQGGFGTVVLAKGRLPGGPTELYAIKCLKKQGITSRTVCEIYTEKAALRISSGYPFITTLYACFQSKVILNFLNFLQFQAVINTEVYC